MSKFRVGDRVQRRQDVFKDDSPMMHGTVIEVYQKSVHREGGDFHYDELYGVEWDAPESRVERGFLPHGLEPLEGAQPEEYAGWEVVHFSDDGSVLLKSKHGTVRFFNVTATTEMQKEIDWLRKVVRECRRQEWNARYPGGYTDSRFREQWDRNTELLIAGESPT